MVIATWGGDYANLLRDNVEEPILKRRRASRWCRTSATRTRAWPRCTPSAACRAARTTWSACRACGRTRSGRPGCWRRSTPTKVPNLAHVLPNLSATFYAPHIWSPQVIIYNPDKVTEPPKTFTDLLDPKWKGRVGVGDINYFYVMMAAALAATGDVNKVDAEDTKALALKLNGNGLRLYPSTDSIGAGHQVGRDRRRADVAGPRDHVAERRHPGEGVVPDRGLGAVHLRHGRAQERAQQGGGLQVPERHAGARRAARFAERMGYLPTGG